MSGLFEDDGVFRPWRAPKWVFYIQQLISFSCYSRKNTPQKFNELIPKIAIFEAGVTFSIASFWVSSRYCSFQGCIFQCPSIPSQMDNLIFSHQRWITSRLLGVLLASQLQPPLTALLGSLRKSQKKSESSLVSPCNLPTTNSILINLLELIGLRCQFEFATFLFQYTLILYLYIHLKMPLYLISPVKELWTNSLPMLRPRGHSTPPLVLSQKLRIGCGCGIREGGNQ